MLNHWPRKSSTLLAIAACLAMASSPVLASHRHHHDDDDSSKSKASATSSSSKSDAKPAQSAPPAAAPKAAAAPAPTAPAPANTDIPDYGGRDSLVSATSTSNTADPPASPLAQAWRAFQALVVVLAMTVGALYLIKKYGLVKDGAFGASGSGKAPKGFAGVVLTTWQNFMRSTTQSNNGTTASLSAGSSDPTAALTVLSSTPLPGAASSSVHLIEVAGRRFLLGATGGGMTLLSDWESEPAGDDVAEENIPSEEERFENYLNRMGMTAQTPPEVVGERVSQTTDRLQALLDRAREEAG